MGGKKNKKAKKPAVGNPAAGSNNKRDKNAVHKSSAKDKNKEQAKKKAAPQKKSAEKKSQKTVAEKKVQNIEQPKKKREKSKKSVNINKEKKKVPKKSTSVKEELEDFKKNYNIGRIAAAAAVLAAVAAGLIILIVTLCSSRFVVPDYVKNAEFKGRTEPESIAFRMDISENQQKALAKATKVKGNRRAFDFFVNDSVVMNEYDDPALIEFGSVSSNECVLMFFMFDENGNEIYRSLGVEPGRQIRSVTFFDELSYGTHDATVVVLGYDRKTHGKVGMQTTQIKLEIGVG